MILAKTSLRFLAFIIDMVIGAVLLTFLFIVNPESSSRVIFWEILGCMYFLPIVTTAFFSASFGKMAMGLKVIDFKTQKSVGFFKGFFRELVNRLTIIAADSLYIPFNPDKKGLHDIIFKTQVVTVKQIKF
jgi:uncharacterized RDD family membrane protein YckC